MRPMPKTPSSRRRSLGFLLRFSIYLVVFALTVASNPVNDAVIVPFTAAVARVSAAILRSLGEPASVVGTEIRSSEFGINIENGCNGIETALMFVSAVLAFPASWRRRIAGLLLGLVAIELLNLVRVVTLFWIGRHRPTVFTSSHTVLWQSGVVLFGVLLFLFWASRQTPLARPAEATPPEER